MNLSYLDLDKEFYELNNPTPLEKPYLIHFNEDLALKLGFKNNDEFLKVINGERLLHSKYFSMTYGGYQFGNYIPLLGDGRVHNIGKVNNCNLQLKGSGETFYSKTADGRCTIDSSIREYLISEAMHNLGVPTSRAIAIIGSDTNLVRSGLKKAGIVFRASNSFIRFGTFEYFYFAKQHDKLKDLIDYTLDESFSHLKNQKNSYVKFFCEVVDKTALTLAKWQALGFCHGVLNSDNISIEGLTMDYGPFAFQDEFKYNFVCNKSDKVGRYSYGEQVNIMYWNLMQLSIALSPHIEKKAMDEKLDEFRDSLYFDIYTNEMKEKLGLFEDDINDRSLVEDLIITLNASYVDYTSFFRILSHYDGNKEDLYDLSYEPVELHNWLLKYDNRLKKETIDFKQRQEIMLNKNPKYILKTYMLDMAIKKAYNQDFSMIEDLFTILKNPYGELPKFEKYFGDVPEEYKEFVLTCAS
jgi:uncharacterized protein YdiU (UPF0061 family)